MLETADRIFGTGALSPRDGFMFAALLVFVWALCFGLERLAERSMPRLDDPEPTDRRDSIEDRARRGS